MVLKSVPKPVFSGNKNSVLKIVTYWIIQFLLAFFVSRTSLFAKIMPFAPSAYLAFGGGIFSLTGCLAGSFSMGYYENIVIVAIVAAIKFIIRNEKWDIFNILAVMSGVYAISIVRSEFTPYDIIIKLLSVVMALIGYYVLKKAYKAQLVKSRHLKFSKNEGYSSMLLLFLVVAGVKSENIVMFVNFTDIIKFYLIAMASYYFGIGGGTTTGAILGLLSGYNFEYSALGMSIYAIFGFFTGIFSKFSKFTAILGLFFSYIFSVMYLTSAANVVDYKDIIIAGIFFMLTPAKLIKPYIERYTHKETSRDMVATINSITSGRLEKLANSFTGLSGEISRVQKNISTMTKVSANSLFDFLGEKVCRKCPMKSLCWTGEYESTVDSLTKAVSALSKNGELTEKDFSKNFLNRCTKLPEIITSCKNFYEILKVNSVWRNKLSENTNAYKQQFLEMSKIICELKKNIEKNKYFDAELTGELYSALSNEGYNLKDVSVIYNADDNYMVRISMYPCKHNENCFIKLKEIIEEVIGVTVSRADGGCGESLCTLIFKEGIVGGIEKRVHCISKNDADPVGDSFLVAEIRQNKYLVALCDGMGSGKKASVISNSVVTLLDEMLKAGFSEEAAHKMINSFLIANLAGQTFSTIDFMVIDTKKMTGKIVKNGACPTYIKKSDGEITEIHNQSLPVGITEQKPFIKTVHLKKDDLVVMVSDGAQDAVEEKNWIRNILVKLPSGALTEAVDLICGVAQRDFENREDDVTVLGIKLI